MNILVVGSGGREHALVQAFKSVKSHRVWSWPGNDGILLDAEAVPVKRNQFKELGLWCKQSSIDLIVIGPEAELVAGLADELRGQGLHVFGPSQAAAELEGSKIFAKEFMQEYAVPTARADVVTSVPECLNQAQKYSPPYVLKADGLAAGKGVFICDDLIELEGAARKIFDEKILGVAGERALLEEFQPGHELSALVLTNGKNFEWLPLCRDHKRLLDGDKGPNTGGMGVVGPMLIDEKLKKEIESQIILKSIAGVSERKFLYRGVLFIGIMVTDSGPQVLEYNVRFGDPETQVILPLLEGDWGVALKSLSLGDVPKLKWRSDSVACLVLAAENYPQSPVLGAPITMSLSDAPAQVQFLHAGTKRLGSQFVTNGGRVMSVVARGATMSAALKLAYDSAKSIHWPGIQYRKDIGTTIK